MKKIILFVITCFLIVTLTSCQTKETLYLFNWNEYIDNSSIDGVNLTKKFEKLYNCRIKPLYFESNEAAITKMETESFDIVIPSEYAIEQLAQDGKIEELDWNKINNYSEKDIPAPLKTMFQDLGNSSNPFDFTKYAVPYFWGNVGICYNPEKVTKEELDTYGWKIFQQTKFKNKVAYYDSSRDGYMVPLKDLGFSMNTTNMDEVNLASEWLNKMKSNVSCSFKTDALLSELPEMQYDLALIYSGDALYCMQMAKDKGKKLDFYIPSSGTNTFVDGMIIPKNAKNKELAYKFISFMCEKENALANSEFVGYTTAVNSAYVEATSSEGAFNEYSQIYNPIYRSGIDEIFRYNKQMKINLNNAWTSFKTK